MAYERKPVELHWYLVPLPLLLISVFVGWRSGASTIGVLDAFELGAKPPEYIVAKVAFVGAFLMAAGCLGMFLTKGSITCAPVAALTGVMAAVFVAIGVTAYTDLQGPTGEDGRHLFIGMPLYVAGCLATLYLAVRAIRAVPARED